MLILIDVDYTCASFEKKINNMTDQMMETMKERIAKYSQCFNQSRDNSSESDSSLGSPKPAVSLDDDFEPSYQCRSNLHDDMPLLSLETPSDLPLPLSPNLTPHLCSPKDVTEDVLVFAIPPTTLNDPF